MRGKKHRFLAMALALSLVLGMTPTVTAAEQSSGGLCEHHTEHTAECGYTEGTPGTPCGHEHTDECYTLVTKCVHEHTEDCYPVESVSANTATPSSTEERKPSACTHVCSEESGCVTKTLDCKHEHDEACGYSPEEPGTPCTFVCEICNPADSEDPAKPEQGPECSCETLCTEENVNVDCPVCGLEDADLSQCKGTAELASPSNATALSVEDVQKLIDALPTAEALAAMTQEEQGAVYNALQAAYDAYEALSDAEKLEVTGAEIFDALFAVFNGMTNVLADSAFNITGGTENNDYTLSGNTLTIKTSESLTISGGTEDNPITGQIVIQSGTSANLTLNGVMLQGVGADSLGNPAKSAIELSSNSSLMLTLCQNTYNTLKGGSDTSADAGAPAIHVPEGRILTVLCANQSGNDHICSDDCGSLSATGGSSTNNFGGVGIGGGTVISATPGASPTSENCGTVLLLGGGT